MRKMAVVISSHAAAHAEEVMKKAKEKLGLKKGARILNHNGLKTCFVSNLVQKNCDSADGLDVYKDMFMVVLQSRPESVKAKPGLYEIKMHINNDLGFAVYICSVPKDKEDRDLDAVADNVVDVIRGNLEL